MDATRPLEIDVDAARDDDLEAVARLRWSWRIEESGGVPALELAGYTDALRAWTASHQRSHHPFVARVDGRVCGMAWLAIIDRVPSPVTFHRASGLVQSVYVTPSLRDRGIGSALVREVLATARALGLEYLLVHPSELSVSFYRRHGFADAGDFLELRLPLSAGSRDAAITGGA